MKSQNSEKPYLKQYNKIKCQGAELYSWKLCLQKCSKLLKKRRYLDRYCYYKLALHKFRENKRKTVLVHFHIEIHTKSDNFMQFFEYKAYKNDNPYQYRILYIIIEYHHIEKIIQMQTQQPQQKPQPQTQTPLQLKLQLLRTLRQGSIQQIQQLVYKIKNVTKVNPQLYQKFNNFVSANKEGLIQMQKQQKQQNEQPKIIIENIDGELDDGEYNSDDSWSVGGSSDEEEQEVEQKKIKPTTVLKQMNNKSNISNVKVQTSSSTNTKKDKQTPTPTNPQLAFKKNTTKPTSSSTSSNITRTTKPKN